MVQYCVLVSHGRHAELPHPRIRRARDVRETRAGVVPCVWRLGDRGGRREDVPKDKKCVNKLFQTIGIGDANR